MALYYTMLRRASSSLAPLAVRAVGSPRSFRGAISTVLNLHDQRLHGKSFLPSSSSSSSSSQSFSTAATVAKKSSSDESLLRIIDSEINHVQENGDEYSVKIPDGFPFVIEDNPGERTILLSRDYQREVIKVLVDMPNPETDEDEDGDGQDGDDDDKDSVKSSIPLVVSVSKGSGLCLEFGVTAFPDEISIDNLSIKTPETSEDQIAYEGPDFSDLDENLQNAFYKYLEIRGIKPSTANFVLEYMINKDHKEYLMWLKNLKSLMK